MSTDLESRSQETKEQSFLIGTLAESIHDGTIKVGTRVKFVLANKSEITGYFVQRDQADAYFSSEEQMRKGTTTTISLENYRFSQNPHRALEYKVEVKTSTD
jgi:hypothetical protein